VESTIVKFFDHLEARWQDEKAHEPFSDYEAAAKQFCQTQGITFISLTAEPFVLKCSHAITTYTVKVDGNKLTCIKEV